MYIWNISFFLRTWQTFPVDIWCFFFQHCLFVSQPRKVREQYWIRRLKWLYISFKVVFFIHILNEVCLCTCYMNFLLPQTSIIIQEIEGDEQPIEFQLDNMCEDLRKMKEEPEKSEDGVFFMDALHMYDMECPQGIVSSTLPCEQRRKISVLSCKWYNSLV